MLARMAPSCNVKWSRSYPPRQAICPDRVKPVSSEASAIWSCSVGVMARQPLCSQRDAPPTATSAAAVSTASPARG